MVHATLLPFEDHIVYAMSLAQAPVAFGEAMLGQIQAEVEQIVANNRIARTGEEFMRMAPRAQKRREETELEDLRHDLEMEERAARPLPGQHRGALCGLSAEERDREVNKHLHETARSLTNAFDPVQQLESWCEQGDIVHTLDELIALHDDPEDTQDAIRALANKEDLFNDLCYKTEAQLAQIRALVDANGRMHIDTEGLDSLKNVPQAARGLCHYFHEENGYAAVMPDEVLAAARNVNRLVVENYCARLNELRTFFDILAELRGIVPFDEALRAFEDAYPHTTIPLGRVKDEVYDAVAFDEMDSSLLDDGTTEYIIHYELLWEWYRQRGEDPYESSRLAEGELGELLEGLLARHARKDPRPVAEEMLAAGSLYDWEVQQPPAVAMRDFLDAHVPDARDDYFFADKVIEELIEEVRWGMPQNSIQIFFDILQNNDFEPNESQLNQLAGLWTNMCNGLPNWPNNGWAPNELLQRTSKRPVFFNPDGSIMKVGRNDPCPCGSGKKYKRCCGR